MVSPHSRSLAMAYWVQDLVDRRVPQLLAIYLGASWAVVEFLSFLEERYLLSPHLTDATLLGLGLLIPSVLVVTWNHGRKGPDRWQRTEKVGIPVNVLGAGAVLFLVFSGKPLGAVTTTVVLEDEEGHSVERVVPRGEFRKRLALFDFEWEDGAAEDAWMGYGASQALALDLDQDLFVDVRTPDYFSGRLRDAGIGPGEPVPLMLRREIARELHLDYIAGGTLSRDGRDLVLEVELLDTDRGRILAERSFRGASLLALVDEASVQLKRDLDVPEAHIEAAADLPAEEILTTSEEAFRALCEGSALILWENDWAGAAEALQRAVDADPTFALAWFILFRVHLYSNRAEEGMTAIGNAMEHLYKVPERIRFQVKADWYFMRQDPAKAWAVLDMWVELYPEDVRGHEARAMVQSLRSEREEAIASYRRVLELDPGRQDVLRTIGELQEASGDFDSALETYRLYADAFPDDWRSFTPIAGLHRARGRHDDARAAYERALVLDPGNVEVLVGLAGLEREVGRFDEALALHREALEAAGTPEERARAFDGLRSHHRFRGETGRALEYLERALAETDRFASPFAALAQRMVTVGHYVAAGREAEALRRLEAYAARLTPPMDLIVPIGYVSYYLEMEDPEGLEGSIARADAAIQALGYEALRPLLAYATGRMHELRGEHEEALDSYRRELELDATDAAIHGQIGRCQRKLGRLDEAERSLHRMLDVLPAHPRGHYDLALVYERRGERGRAIEHLDRALLAWADADDAYRPAREAREKRVELASAVAP